MSDLEFDTVVIGAGAIGLAIGTALSQRGQSVLILERGNNPGEATTARNSEVIHAGLYYPTGSLKHQYCVSGRRLLYTFLQRTGVTHRKCGKLIVATTAAEEDALAQILAVGTANGVEGLRMLSTRERIKREPEVSATAALYSPETGIFDSHACLQNLLAIFEHHGGLLALRTDFAHATSVAKGFRVTTGGKDPTAVTTRHLVNAGGLWAPEIAGRISGLAPEQIPNQRMAKGSYFRLVGRSPFSHLIYPVPVDGGLGVHATLDLAGAARFGPDVEWLPAGLDPDQIDYAVAPDRATAFANAIRCYWPGLSSDRLVPDYSGVRPKLGGPGREFSDFVLQTEAQHGLSGLINLFGIESPGLTSALAIGETVAQKLGD